MSFFTIWTVQSAVTCESGRTPSRKSILALTNWCYIFHISCTTVYFHTVISLFNKGIYTVFVIDSTRKQTFLIKWFSFVFTKDLPSINQSNVQAVNAEKEE